MGLLLALFVFGIAKAAVMPMHFWLPAAMVAPTPVSALLHAVAVVKAGVFSIVKVIVYVFGIETLKENGAGDWLVYVAGFTVITASLMALRQDNLKRRLAYSTISQLSYVVLGASLLNPVAMLGASLHIAAHAVSKITLFFAAGSLHTAAHIDYVSEMDGIGYRMPWTMGAFAVGALSMIGMPLDRRLPRQMVHADRRRRNRAMVRGRRHRHIDAAQCRLFPADRLSGVPRRPDGKVVAMKEAPWPMVVALTVTAALTILLFFFPGVPWRLAEMTIGG